MTKEKKHKILNDEDFIDYPKFKNSLSKLIEKHPEGVDVQTIAKVLNMTEEEVEKTYQSAIQKLKDNLGV
jgi:predicted metallo-beta-lactamase superfamily hydrolase